MKINYFKIPVDKYSCQCYIIYDNFICHFDIHNSQEVFIVPLYNKVKEYRARFQINQTELSSLAGVSRQTISLIERGDYSPSVILAIKIAQIFETTVEDIFRYEEEKSHES